MWGTTSWEGAKLCISKELAVADVPGGRLDRVVSLLSRSRAGLFLTSPVVYFEARKSCRARVPNAAVQSLVPPSTFPPTFYLSISSLRAFRGHRVM
jgi:hypothetical protein